MKTKLIRPLLAAIALMLTCSAAAQTQQRQFANDIINEVNGTIEKDYLHESGNRIVIVAVPEFYNADLVKSIVKMLVDLKPGAVMGTPWTRDGEKILAIVHFEPMGLAVSFNMKNNILILCWKE